MGVSTAERREVAKRLRAYDGDGMELSHARKALGIQSRSRSTQDWGVVFDRLAELIEPDEAEEEEMRFDGTY